MYLPDSRKIESYSRDDRNHDIDFKDEIDEFPDEDVKEDFEDYGHQKKVNNKNDDIWDMSDDNFDV